MYCRLDLGRRRGNDRAEVVRWGGVYPRHVSFGSRVQNIFGRQVPASGGKCSKKLARCVRLKGRDVCVLESESSVCWCACVWGSVVQLHDCLQEGGPWWWETNLALLHDRAGGKRWRGRGWRLLRCKISSMCAASMVVVGARPITWLRSVWCFGVSALEGSRMRCRVCQGSCSGARRLYESLLRVTKPLFGIWTHHSLCASSFCTSRPCNCLLKSSPSSLS